MIGNLECWTVWFNIDNPGWTGDYEKLETLRNAGYKVCKQPEAVRCRTVHTHIDAKLTGRKLTCSPSVGFFCVNSDQDWGKTCLDYEVKFLCPCNYVDAPTKPPFDLRMAFALCFGCWTAWLDRDGPGGTGDYEQRDLFSRPICDRPGSVQCRRTSNHQAALKTGQKLFCTPALGLVCINKNQPSGQMCYNYEVRFLCPCPDGLTNVPPTSQLISSLPPLQSGIKNKPIVLYVVLGAIGILLTIIALVFIRFKIQRKRVLNVNERESDNTGNYESKIGEMEISTPPPSYSVAVMEMESEEL
ncbi:mucin-5AC-like [Oscarella lobularis]|uniref:mucin-5AC-like n=1 Tax=Oscarella lobularis TaxID=121494 RepID=UPI003313EB6B